VSQGPSGRLYPAIVHAPFRPVGYVIIDDHLLLPATWHDPGQSVPGVGGLVAVEFLPWLRPEALPLVAYPAPPAPESVPESDPAPEEIPMQEISPEP
jgi:hypothetical protein